MINSAALTKAQRHYVPGAAVEILVHDFAVPGYPLVWIPAVVTDVKVMNAERRLITVIVRMSDDGRPKACIVGPRGGGKSIRLAA